tara:strand:+ start:628 stop:1095 length:468 start_codon:yes stop_codon:yes gene_type:complete
MELSTFTDKFGADKQKAAYTAVLDNVAAGRPALRCQGSLSTMKVFRNQILFGSMAGEQAQTVMEAIHDNLEDRRDAPTSTKAQRAGATSALALADEVMAYLGSSAAPVVVPVVPEAPQMSKAKKPTAASNAHDIGVLMSQMQMLTQAVTQLVERS